MLHRLSSVGLALALAAFVTSAAPARADSPATGPSRVELRQADGGWQLFRDGRPYFIQGAGGDASKRLLKDCGGNSFRTWGSDDIGDKLDEAAKLGLSVTVGFWLGHEEQHFDYNNAAQVSAQYERARAAILKYKDHPAVLMWAVGNEMEGYKNGDNAKIWSAVEGIAALAHKLDPNHPTMTVVAEIGGERVSSINRLCPDIDIIGINSYGGGPSLAQRYRAAGGVKPFIITEFGPAGTWETGKNAWGAPHELPSTEKAAAYRATYKKSVLAEKGKLCLGSYVFAWGNKQEATATWYGLFLTDGTRLEAIDTMTELWGGAKPASRCPQIQPLKADHDSVNPGDAVHVALDVTDPDGNPLTVKWVLQKDPGQYDTGGESQAVPPSYPEAIVKSDAKGADLRMPKDGGGYWLYAFAYDGKGGAAVVNLPLHVSGAEPSFRAKTAALPFALYGEGAHGLPYVWSGWMGDISSVAMDEKCTTNPHSGATCMKCEFRAAKGFGGIVWQSPANDWGDAPGGFNLTGASKLTFWARGEEGGEQVAFKLGLLGADKKFHDSAQAGADVTLGKDWKQYAIDLAGKDLSCIKTGFAWIVGSKGKPVMFYLADIRYEGSAGGVAPTTAPAAAASASVAAAESAPEPAPAKAAGVEKPHLPLALYEDDMKDLPYVWSGWMGNTNAIAMDEKCATNPHSGGTCMKCEYRAADGFGGIVWQSPANDWGDKAGGYDLTGATKLTFWARGEDGGELLAFKLGLIGKDKPFHDSDQAGVENVKLEKDWKQYTIDLTGKDLSCIKTGFAWIVAGKGKPVTFYLDDVRYEP